MKNTKLTSSLLLAMMVASNVSAYSKVELENMFKEKVYWGDLYIKAANYLATDGIIVDQKANPVKYELNRPLMRQEMAWIIRKVLWIDKKTKCDWKFKDLTANKPNNWACFSIEPLLDKWFIAKNENYRPEDSVSKAEALSFVIKSLYGEEYKKSFDPNLIWEENAVKFAKAKGLLREDIWDYKAKANRGFIFSIVHYANVSNNLKNISSQTWTSTGTVVPSTPSNGWSTSPTTTSTGTVVPSTPSNWWSTSSTTTSTGTVVPSAPANTWATSPTTTSTGTVVPSAPANTWSTSPKTTSTGTVVPSAPANTWSTSSTTTSTDTVAPSTPANTWSTSPITTSTSTDTVAPSTPTNTWSTSPIVTSTSTSTSTSTDTVAPTPPANTWSILPQPKPYDPCTDWTPRWPWAWEVNTKCFNWSNSDYYKFKNTARMDIYWV